MYELENLFSAIIFLNLKEIKIVLKNLNRYIYSIDSLVMLSIVVDIFVFMTYKSYLDIHISDKNMTFARKLRNYS